MLFKILIFSVLAFSDSESKQDRKVSRQQIYDGCYKAASLAADVKKKVCDCIASNLDAKANDYEMEILAKQYTKPTDSLNGSALLTFDADVAENCVANPKWKSPPRSLDSIDSKGKKK